eukprot:2508529-Amphidinium_carterae.1
MSSLSGLVDTSLQICQDYPLAPMISGRMELNGDIDKSYHTPDAPWAFTLEVSLGVNTTSRLVLRTDMIRSRLEQLPFRSHQSAAAHHALWHTLACGH